MWSSFLKPKVRSVHLLLLPSSRTLLEGLVSTRKLRNSVVSSFRNVSADAKERDLAWLLSESRAGPPLGRCSDGKKKDNGITKDDDDDDEVDDDDDDVTDGINDDDVDDDVNGEVNGTDDNDGKKDDNNVELMEGVDAGNVCGLPFN